MATDFSKMRVVDLKAELKKRGLPQSGLKQELIERLRQAEALAPAKSKPPSSSAETKKDPAPKPSAKKDVSTSAHEPIPAPASADDVPIAEPAVVERPPEKGSSVEQPLAHHAAVEQRPLEDLRTEPARPPTNAVQSVKAHASHGASNGTTGLPPSLSTILNHDDNNISSADQAPTLEAVGDPGTSNPAIAPLPDPTSSEVPSIAALQDASLVNVEEPVSEIRKRKRRSGSPSPTVEEVAQKRARVSDEGIQKDSGGDIQPPNTVETMQVDVPDTEQRNGTAVQAASELNHVAMDVEETKMDDAGLGPALHPSNIPAEEATPDLEHATSPAEHAPTKEPKVEDTKMDDAGSDHAPEPSSPPAEGRLLAPEQTGSSAEQMPAEESKVEQEEDVTAPAEPAQLRLSPQRAQSPAEQAPTETLKGEQQQATLSPQRSPFSPQRERVSVSKDARFKGLFNVGASKDRDVQDAVEPADDISDRVVEAALHPATSALYIRELMRPLHAPTLKAHLTALTGRPGSASHPDVITEFFLDSIRTHCLVAFANVSAAARVRSALHQTVWPEERSRKALWVDFVPEEKIREWIETEQRAAGGAGGRGGNKRWEVVYEDDHDGDNGRTNGEGPGGVRAVLREVGTHGPSGGGGRGQGAKGAPLGPRGRDYEPGPTASSNQQQQARRGPTSKSTSSGFMALDSLFASTASKPKLYFLPVAKGLAERRLDEFEKLSSQRGGRGGARRGGRRGGEELHRYTFEDGDLLVDEGPELGGGQYRGNGGPPGPPPRRAGENSWHRSEGRPRPPPYRRDRW